MKLTNLLIVCGLLIFSYSCKKDNCKNTNCLNGGICNDGKCNCPPGYSGERCEVRDSCYGLKCENGSTCKGDSCACLPTFYGKNCEKNKLTEKVYVVKNLKLTPIYENPSSNKYKDCLNDGDTLSVVVTVSDGETYLRFQHPTFKTYNYKLFPNYFSFSDNYISGDNFADSHNAVFNNSGDSIHFTIIRYYQLNNTYADIIKCDLVKQ